MVPEQHPDKLGIGHLFWLTSDAIVAADLDDHCIVLWNPAATSVFGYEADEALGMKLERLVPSDLRDAHLDGIGRYASTGSGALVGAGAVDVAALTRDGQRRDVSLSLTDLTGPTGQRVVLAMIRDVTDQRESERDLRRLNAVMREFVAIASHDLRSPLTTISGFADLLGNDQMPVEVRKRALETVKRNAELASRLVDDLLTLSQIEAGAIRTARGVVRLREIADEVMHSTGIAADNHIDPAAAAFADPDHVRRILVNYLTNASHYGRPPISLEADVSAPHVAVRVWDAGDGVDPDLVDELFSPFSPARSDRSSSGLGLSIVRGLVRANGGDVFYEKTPSMVCFGVLLPLAA